MSPNWFSLKLKVVINILSNIFGPQYIGSGGLPSLGSLRVGHDWSDLAAAVAAEWLLWLSECVQRTLLKSWNLHWMTIAVSHKETVSQQIEWIQVFSKFLYTFGRWSCQLADKQMHKCWQMSRKYLITYFEWDKNTWNMVIFSLGKIHLCNGN